VLSELRQPLRGVRDRDLGVVDCEHSGGRLGQRRSLERGGAEATSQIRDGESRFERGRLYEEVVVGAKKQFDLFDEVRASRVGLLRRESLVAHETGPCVVSTASIGRRPRTAMTGGSKSITSLAVGGCM
jgi:hypothetical protein